MLAAITAVDDVSEAHVVRTAIRHPSYASRFGDKKSPDPKRSVGVKRAALLLLALLSLAWTPPEPTKQTDCHARGLLPDAACTPGAVETTSLAVVCGSGTRGRRDVNRVTKRRVFEAYGLAPHQPPGAYEIDHLVPLGLGGSNEVANLWPEPASGFHDKDRVEDTLHRRVCSGAMRLDAAQEAIATDWTALR
jgi:hypothetical protein